jgi:hypothetical protein
MFRPRLEFDWMMRLIPCAFALLALAAGPSLAENARAAVPAPAGDLAEMLSGKFVGDGEFLNQRDGTRRGLKLDILGSYDGRVLTLVEDTAFSDGEKQHKVWTFTSAGDHRWIGRRSDLIGDAQVTQDGNKVRMVYRAHVPKDGKTWDLKFDEHYDIQSPDVIVSKTDVSYLFFTVGVANLTIRRAGK